jgi:MFS family permease
MPDVRALLASDWRAVPVLGFIQIVAWGTLFFPVVLVVPIAASERGWSPALAMSGFSAALLVSGLASPRMGRLVDRLGGHRVIPAGTLIAAGGLALLPLAESVAAWMACWCVIGIAMAATLYDAAFATLGRIFGSSARKPITWLTLVSGFASTLSWPASHALIESIGWRSMYFIYASLLAVVIAPLAAFALPRSHYVEPRVERASGAGPARTPEYVPSSGVTFLLVAAGFASYGFYHGGYSAHLIAMFNRLGLDAGTVVALASISGPAQVATRLVEIVFGRGAMHPLWMARSATALLVTAFGVLALFGISRYSVAAFFLMYGIANGVFTIARGALPLALFGPAGYGHVMGRIALPFLFMQASAPIVIALVIERFSDAAALVTLAAFVALSLACLSVLRKP